MNIFNIRTGAGKINLTILALLSVLIWATGAPAFLSSANAAALTNVSDTLTDSDLNVASAHRLLFTTVTALDADDTIEISLDPGSDGDDDEFTINNLGATDFHSTTTVRVVGNTVGACTGSASELYVSTSTAPDDKVTLTVCTGDSVTPGIIGFTMGATSTPKITNPNSVGSEIILIQTRNEGGQASADIIDSAETRVAIIDDVTVTASVDSTFTFTITGVANGQAVNGSATTTSTTTTATLIPFETLSPNSSKVLAQDLAVTTNAANGFIVTVVQDQNLTSSTGADIDLFTNGATTSTPIAWTTPTNTLNQEWTYGHIGITSEDADLNSNEFGTDLWAGNFHLPRQVFSHTGPSDGSTPNQGSTRVGYQIEIDSLQEAASDYTNTLTYVATPTF
ncbi:MAG: hypothetical protein WA021_03705 [Minisyncoccia bacterium]